MRFAAEWGFRLVNKAKDEDLLFWCANEPQMRDWLKELEQAIQVLEVNALCAST